jgi:hypothetical protein
MDPRDVAAMRAKKVDAARNWATPESMAATIVDGIREGRFHIPQHNPWQDNWLGELFRRKAADPDAFVLGG